MGDSDIERPYGFTFQPKYFEAMNFLDYEDKAALALAILYYGGYGKEPENLSERAQQFFTIFREDIDYGVGAWLRGKRSKANKNTSKEDV